MDIAFQKNGSNCESGCLASLALRLDVALGHEPILDRVAAFEATLLGAVVGHFSDPVSELICSRVALPFDDLRCVAWI